MASIDAFWQWRAFRLPAHDTPPHIRHPGQIDQWKARRLLTTLFFHGADREPVSSARFVRLEKRDGCFQRGILMRGAKRDRVQKLEQQGAMASVELSEKRIIRVG